MDITFDANGAVCVCTLVLGAVPGIEIHTEKSFTAREALFVLLSGLNANASNRRKKCCKPTIPVFGL